METSDSFLNGILANGPSPGTLFLVLSRLKEEGRLKEVILECRRALDVHPGDIPIRRLLAETYYESGRIPQAETEMNRVISQIEELMNSYVMQARILVHQKRDEEAVRMLKLYLAHRPDDTEARSLLDNLLAPDKTLMEPEVEEEGLPEIATPTLAELYFRQGHIDDAVTTYERILARDPDNMSARQRLDELKGVKDHAPVSERNGKDDTRGKKFKTISILENWLTSIRKQSKEDLTSGEPAS